MKMMKLSSKMIWLALPLLALCLSAGLLNDSPTLAQSAGQAKVGTDVRQKAQSGGRVNVIVQATTAWNSTLDSAVTTPGGNVTRSYRNFNVRAASLPAAAIDGLANRPDVAFISLDTQTLVLGHVSATTGGDAASAMTGTSYADDGTGGSIGARDSG